MAKFKNKLINIQVISLFIIPLIPHYILFPNLHSDDIPVFIFLIFFVISILTKKISILNSKDLKPILLFILYICLQNFYINGQFLFSELFRYIFYFLIFVTIINLSSEINFDKYFFYLFFALTTFSIVGYFFEIQLGTDSYAYWNIGFNSNQWIFTNGRMNGFQAGGPNAFGGLIAFLGIFCTANSSGFLKNIVIIFCTLGCFFTYSRAALIVFFAFLLFNLIYSKSYSSIFFLLVSLIFISMFGLIDRFTSEEETEGIEDRLQMQEATLINFNERNVIENLIGYGFGNYGIVRNSIQSIDEFDEDVRPTGPHNSFLFMILNYGIFGILLFLNIFAKPFFAFLKNIKTNLNSPYYLSLGSFVALSLTGDFIQNHSISVIFFLTFFIVIGQINEK